MTPREIANSTLPHRRTDANHHAGGIILGCTHLQLDMLDGYVDHNAGILERQGASHLSHHDGWPDDCVHLW